MEHVVCEREFKKKGMVKYTSKTMCTHSKGANKKALKTELGLHTCILFCVK